MRAAALCAIAALAAGCYTNAFSNAAKEKEIQRRNLSKAMPAGLEVARPLPGEARTAHVRVWVDEDYRAGTLHWRQQIEEQLDEANQFLVPAVGVRLDAKAIEPWPARSADRKLGDVLTALEAQDPGDDVDWVIGYASALSLVEGTFEELGVARPLGRHVVVRGYADGAERKAFAQLFPDTSDAERERVHLARRRHKQTVVLLHELAHTLGAPHENDPTWLLAATYSPEMATLSEPSRAIMQLSLETWLAPRASFDVRTLAARLTSYFEGNPWGGWDDDAKGEFLAALRVIVDASGGAAAGLAGAANEQLLAARRLAQAGKLGEALAELDAIAAAYPASPDVRMAICELRVARDGATDDAAVKACQRVADVAPDDPRPQMVLAGALASKGDLAGARAHLAAVDAMAGDRVPVWMAAAEAYLALGLVSDAERAARSAEQRQPGVGADVLAWVLRTRGRYGLPPGGVPGKIAPADEPAYVAAVRDLLAAIYADKFADAKKLAKAAGKRWRGAPGLLAAECDLALRQQALPAARKLCDQAIAAWSGAAWALYLRGVMLAQANKLPAGIASLRAAIAAEPELAQAYRALGKALDRAGDAAAKAQLATEYQARFGAALP